MACMRTSMNTLFKNSRYNKKEMDGDGQIAYI